MKFTPLGGLTALLLAVPLAGQSSLIDARAMIDAGDPQQIRVEIEYRVELDGTADRAPY